MYGIMGGMEKTTIYLTTEQKAALAAAAREEGRSEARLIREGIDGVLSGRRIGETATPLSGEPGATDVARDDRPTRPRWMSRKAFARQVVPVQADAALGAELRELAPDLTDELPAR
jgi:hypothetical protein